MDDATSAHKGFDALQKDENLSQEYRSVAKNNLAVMKFHKFQESLREANHDFNKLDEKEIFEGEQILTLLKESIKGFENTNQRSEEDAKTLESLLDINSYGPEEFYNNSGKAQFFDVVKHPLSGITLTNICEEMLLQGPRMDKKHTSFWYVAGLKFHEKYETDFLARHLTLLAIFYHAQERTMIAEGLLTRALELTKGKGDIHEAFTFKIYGHILRSKPSRVNESEKFTTRATEIEQQLVPWTSKLVQMHIPVV
uniref:Uncharacterized protein n=1 Tax=Euplotes crassus TaxID=5936 RepID=A0A7S3KAY1_EUPCR|mmetsp:Transcript_1476/g.1427  ORF Transcript_1476/g.1427 Transcript_1476/m.1427 type:complete len:254 (+) Transcript_1476:419-1180(+)